MGFEATLAGRQIASLNLGKYVPLMKLVGKYLGLSALVVGAIWFVVSAFIGFTNQPQKVRVTNVTGSSATISWITSKKDAGQVIVSDDSKFTIWPFSLFSRDNKFFDDRDVALAQEESLAKWINKASKDADATFSITSENAQEIYDYKVKKQGNYFVHHVTVFDLDESLKYDFKVGNGWRFWSYNSVNQDITENDAPVASSFEFTTYKHPTSIPAPSPAYGKVFGMVKVDGDFLVEDESKDSVVFYKLVKADGNQSNILSSVTNEQGGWTVDRSNWRDEAGLLTRFTTNADTAELWFNYQDVAPREKKILLLGVDDEPADGLLGNYEDTAKSNENLIMKASRFIRTGVNGYLEDMGELVSSSSTSLQSIGFVATADAKVVIDDCLDRDFAKANPNICGTPSNPGPQTHSCSCCDGKVTVNVNTSCSNACKNKGGEDNGKCKKDEPPAPEPAEEPAKEVTCSSIGVLSCYVGGVEPACRCQRSDNNKWVVCTGKDQPVKNCQASCTPASCASPSNAPGLDPSNTYVDSNGHSKLCPATKDKCGGNDECLGSCFKSDSKIGMCCTKDGQYDWITASSGTADYCGTYKGAGWSKDSSKSSASLCAVPSAITGTCCHSADKTSIKWDASATFSCPSTHPQSSKTTQPSCQPVIAVTTPGTCCTSATGLDQSWSPTVSGYCPEKWNRSITTAQQCPAKASEPIDYGGVCCKFPIADGENKGGVTLNWIKRVKETATTKASVICGADRVSDITTPGSCTGITPPVRTCPVGAVCDSANVWDGKSCQWNYELKDVILDGKRVGRCMFNSDAPLCPPGQEPIKQVSVEDSIGAPGARNVVCESLNRVVCCQYQTATVKYEWLTRNECKKRGSESLGALASKCDAELDTEQKTSVCCTYLLDGETKYNRVSRVVCKSYSGTELIQDSDKCTNPVLNPGARINNFSPTPVSAAEPQSYVSSGDGIFIFQEAGTYKVNYGDKDVTVYVSKDVPNLLFAETNNTPGYQAGEDTIISQDLYDVSVEQISKAHSLNLKTGINLVSFNFLPQGSDTKPLMASELLSINNATRNSIRSITYFENGAWDGGLVAPEEIGKTPAGRDFPLQFGRGYLIVSNYDTTIEVPGFDILDPIPLSLKSGWNLVGIHGFNTPYTAHSFASSITALGTVTADNVTKWDTAKGRYEGIQISQDTLYGFDYPIQQDLGYFVRISEFKPTSPDSLSIIWAPGTDKHGTEAK